MSAVFGAGWALRLPLQSQGRSLRLGRGFLAVTRQPVFSIERLTERIV
jgi:hypothetical protein